MDWTTSGGDDNPEVSVIPETPDFVEAPEVPRTTSTRGAAGRTALLVTGGLVLVAAIGGSGFLIGHYVGGHRTNTAIGSFPRNQFPQFPSGGFGNFPSGGSSVTPTTLPANAPSTATAAKIARKVDPGIVDISTTSKYQSSSAAGTGMILSANGLVLTNNHVINGATSISVRVVTTNKTYRATVLGYSVTKDVALLQLSGASGLTAVTTADSNSVHSSDPVVGIGNAGGVGGTPSAAPGAVVATDQSLTASDPSNLTGAEKLSGMIQIAANIQPGDSGGPLVNTQGQVIGMDTAGSSTGSGFGGESQYSTAGEGYAIPINTALAVVSTIESGASTATVHVGATPILGVEISPTLSGYEGNFNNSSVAGVQIAGLAAGTPAASSGMVAGDVITALNGQSITSATQLSAIVQTLAPGDSIKVSYTTVNGTTATANVKLIAGPAL